MFIAKNVITDRQVGNWCSKFPSDVMSLRGDPRPGLLSDLDQDAFRELVEYSLRGKSSRIST